MKIFLVLMMLVLGIACTTIICMDQSKQVTSIGYTPLPSHDAPVIIASEVIKYARERRKARQEARTTLFTDLLTTNYTLIAQVQIERAKNAALFAALELRREQWRLQDEAYEAAKK